jgi:hypothetical protein
VPGRGLGVGLVVEMVFLLGLGIGLRSLLGL